MSLFAIIAPHQRVNELPILIEAAFMLAVLICFLRVAGYVARKLESGRLINGRHAPMDFIVPPLWGWLFTASVLALVFMQSIFYIFLVLMGLAGLLLENGRTAAEQFGFRRLPASILIKWSLLVCGAVLFVETPLSRLWFWAMDAVHLPHPEQQTVETFRGYRRPLEVLAFMSQAVILFPMIEELFFRGFLLTFLKKYTTTWMALVSAPGSSPSRTPISGRRCRFGFSGWFWAWPISIRVHFCCRSGFTPAGIF